MQDWKQSNYDRYPKVIKKTFNQYRELPNLLLHKFQLYTSLLFNLLIMNKIQ